MTEEKKAEGQGKHLGVANALRFEREKNRILLDEVVSLEDALVNRQMAEFEDVMSDETREFWREQLISNREKAELALGELARAKDSHSAGQAGNEAEPTPGPSEEGNRRRPLHNRLTARPRVRGADGKPAQASESAHGRAAKIRNRAHELCKVEGIPFSTAFRRAEREATAEE